VAAAMSRFEPRELSVGRLAQAATRRIRDLPHRLSWRLHGGVENRARLAAYRNVHHGERCFVLGNGPSLLRTDLSRLDAQLTFGANRIYLAYQPSYYVAINELVLEQWSAEIAALPMPKFLSWNRRRCFSGVPQALFVRLSLGLRDRFRSDVTRPLASGGTVTFVSLQLARYMGFREVVLLGVDHRFVDRGTPNREEVRTAPDANHFDPTYFPVGARWQLPDLRRSELAYATARRAFEEAGGRILDATIDGACQVFEKVDLEKVL
jgi:hypothetical protein